MSCRVARGKKSQTIQIGKSGFVNCRSTSGTHYARPAHIRNRTSFPSMFKRIQKKQKKAELEEELGLDDDVKQTLGLGMHDTDTDESESESDSESEFGEDIAGDLGIGVDGGAGEDSEGVEEDAEEDEEENGLELEGTPPMTLDVALRSPIYSISLDSDVRTCLVCARKLLKNSKMVEVHLKSGVRLAHHVLVLAH